MNAHFACALLTGTDRIHEETKANTATAVGQTVQIGDNYLNDVHLPCHNGRI